MAELKFRELQAQQLAKNLFAAQDEKKMAAPARRPPPPPVAMNPGATLSLPPPGLIPESLVRDILALIKKEYPKAEAVLASKMSKEQFKLFLDELPQLKNIITSRMPVVPATAQVPPATLKAVKEKSGAAGKSAADLEREKKERRRIVTLRFVQLLLQIKKCTEVGLLYEEILNEPMSPMIMSMVHSMVLQVKVRGAEVAVAVYNISLFVNFCRNWPIIVVIFWQASLRTLRRSLRCASGCWRCASTFGTSKRPLWSM